MRYEYDVVDLRTRIFALRKQGNHQADSEIVKDYLNDMGSKGWKVVNCPEQMVVWFERQSSDKRKV